MPRIITYSVQTTETVKNILKNKLKMSERFIRKLKLNEKITCDSKYLKINNIVESGNVLTIDLNFEEESENIDSINMPLDILYEDDWLIVINKPANMVVHPSVLHRDDSLANAVKYYLDSKNEKIKMRFVNRLDRDTTGIVVFAKSEYIQESLAMQMQEGKLVKEYRTIIEGILEGGGTIDKPIKRQEGSIMLREVAEDGERAVTHYEVLQNMNNMSLVKVILETGRTHQIRVHMKSIGHPLVGDDLYGNKSELIGRQALHAYKMIFIHPITNEKMEFISEIPDDMKKIIKNE
ncbi:MAG: RluA family pseudouridine synthase [Clostridiales bacterium]|nr:RluA family pseudouridine synthase [Clostridiales bacterium]